VREGRRLEEVADAVAEQGISVKVHRRGAGAQLALSAARPGGFEFLEDATRNASLEGTCTATYSIRKDDTVRRCSRRCFRRLATT
jgi:hypothetical protein